MRPSDADAIRNRVSCGRADRCGVTLLEVLLVILVLSGAAIASSFVLDGNWIRNRNVNDLTIEVARTLDEARNTAIANKSVVRVRHSRQNGTDQLQISEEAGPYRGERQRTIELGGETRLRVRPSEIAFTAQGTALRSATWTVSQGRVSGQVVVSPTTGKISTRLP